MLAKTAFGLALGVLSFALPCAAEVPAVRAEASHAGRHAALARMRRRFLSPVLSSEDPTAAPPVDIAAFSALEPLRQEADFLRAGRVDGFDDWPTYADMVVYVAGRLGVVPPESALAVYRGRVRPQGQALTADEARARSSLLAAISEPEFVKRYLYIPNLVDTPQPAFVQAPEPVLRFVRKKMKGRRKYRRVRVRVARGPELAPPPKPVCVIDKIDWDKTDQLADVAEANARNWERRKGETRHKYLRRLRRLRKHCYEWVRRDIAALGLWDDFLFRGEVAGTRRDPKRAIRAASFALAMAKIEAADSLAARTPLREMNLRVDPIVRGAILVFAQNVCGFDRRSGHIEIVTSVVPLRAASYKFHDVRSDCLVRASAQNKVHVYVPLRRDVLAPAPKA